MTLHIWNKLMKDKRFKYHAFISNNANDRQWARMLAQRLRKEGLRIFDEDSIMLGEDIVRSIESGIRSSRHVILVLTPGAVSSEWVTLELSVSLYRDPRSAARTLIPVLRQDCEIPLTLQRLKYLDARSEDFEEQFRSLLRAIDLSAVDEPQTEGINYA